MIVALPKLSTVLFFDYYAFFINRHDPKAMKVNATGISSGIDIASVSPLIN
jgi:hypothetical protein